MPSLQIQDVSPGLCCVSGTPSRRALSTEVGGFCARRRYQLPRSKWEMRLKRAGSGQPVKRTCVMQWGFSGNQNTGSGEYAGCTWWRRMGWYAVVSAEVGA